MCAYNPECPAPDVREAFRPHVIAPHPEQGWCLLCDGAILFDDGGVILPDGSIREPGMAA
jgi:hypothetical protein